MGNNKINGLYELYDCIDNKLIQSVTYFDNLKHGEEKTYYKGEFKSLATYQNDIINGIYVEYYTNEDYDNIEFINYKHRLDDAEELYPSKRLKVRSYYHDGKYNGDYIEYHDNGNIKKKVYYRNGIMEGLLTEYYYDGNIKTKMLYTNGIIKKEQDIFYLGGINISKYLNKKK